MKRALVWSLVAAVVFGGLVWLTSPAYSRVRPDITFEGCPAEDQIMVPVQYHGTDAPDNVYRCVTADDWISDQIREDARDGGQITNAIGRHIRNHQRFWWEAFCIQVGARHHRCI